MPGVLLVSHLCGLLSRHNNDVIDRNMRNQQLWKLNSSVKEPLGSNTKVKGEPLADPGLAAIHLRMNIHVHTSQSKELKPDNTA